MSDVLMVIVAWAAAVYVSANAIYAILSPPGFLKARLTTRRGLSPETRNQDVRGLGIIFVVLSAFLIWFSCGLTLKVLGGDEGRLHVPRMSMNSAIIVGWWVGTLFCLVNGIFAFVAPAKWITSRWGRTRIPGLTNTKLVRTLGVIFTLAGAYWAFQGVRMMQGLLGR